MSGATCTVCGKRTNYCMAVECCAHGCDVPELVRNLRALVGELVDGLECRYANETPSPLNQGTAELIARAREARNHE